MAYGMGNGQQPIIVLREGTERSKNRDAQTNNIAAARAVADAVRSTLGPKGMDKMLVDSMGDVVITNDGVTILKEIDVQHPAAKMVVEVAKTQDSECGDGTTSSVIIAGELLKKAESLIEQNIHPTIIANGYKMAAAEALKVLDTIAVPVTAEDDRDADQGGHDRHDRQERGRTEGLPRRPGRQGHQGHRREERHGKWTVDVDNIKVEKKTGGIDRRHRDHQGHRARQGARPPEDGQAGQERQDRAALRRPRDQEDRGRGQDPDPRPASRCSASSTRKRPP